MFFFECIEKKFCFLFNFLKQYQNNKICIALSGGIDSMSLLFLTKFFIDEYVMNIEIYAVIVDHALRAESADEANIVANILDFYKINHHIISLKSGLIPLKNTQSCARKIRYKAISDWCINNGISCVMTGHHIEDQSETVLMRIFRGSGVSGIRAINKKVFFNGVLFVRPLLEVSKKDLYKYSYEHCMPFVEDGSNFLDKYDRNKIRKIVNNLRVEFDSLDFKLYQVASNMESVESFIDRCKFKIIIDHLTLDIDSVVLSFDVLKEDLYLVTVVFSYIVKVISECDDVKFNAIENVVKAIKISCFYNGSINGVKILKDDFGIRFILN